MAQICLRHGVREDTEIFLFIKGEDMEVDIYNNFLKLSAVRPASLTIPPIVKALIGFFRGIVRNLIPSDMTMCFFSWRVMLNPAYLGHN